MPTSWQSVLCETANNSVQTTNYHSGSKSLKITQTGSGAANYVVMPQLTGLNVTGLELNFWAKPSTGATNVGALEVGYITDITDASSFVLVEAITYNDFYVNYSTIYGEKTVFLTNLPTGARIAFRNTPTMSSRSWYIDDITVNGIYPCQKPINFTKSMLTDTSVTFSWTMRGESEPEFGDTTSVFSLSVIDGMGAVVANFPSFRAVGPQFSHAVAGLQPGTTYTARVSAECGSGHGNSGEAIMTFTTFNAPLALPYTENFNSMITMPNEFNQNASINTSTSYVYQGSGKSLKLASSTKTGDAYYVFPLLNATLNDIQMSMMVTTGSEYATTDFEVYHITDPTDLSDAIQLYSGTAGGPWSEARFNTGTLTETASPVLLMIRIEGRSGNTNSTYFDNVRVMAIPSCMRPEGVSIDSIGAHGLKVSWTANATDSILVKATSAADNTVVSAFATSSPFVLTGLTDNTEYNVTLQRYCSANDSSEETLPMTLTTLCDAWTTPLFSEDFDDLNPMQQDAIPSCWTAGWIYQPYPDPYTPYPFMIGYESDVDFSSSDYDNQIMELMPGQANGTLSYLSTNKFHIDNANEYIVSIKMYRQLEFNEMYHRYNEYYNEGIAIWMTPNPGDTTGGTKLGFIHSLSSESPVETTTGWHTYEFIINRAGDMCLTIVAVSDNEMGGFSPSTVFDDVEIKAAPSCFPVSNIALDETDNDTVKVVWNQGTNETQWIVDYTLKQGNVTIIDTVDTVSTREIIISGLQGSSVYTVSGTVASYCGEDETAEAVTFSFSFTTPCEAISTLPYVCGFESTEIAPSTGGYMMPICWTRFDDCEVQEYADPWSYDMYYNGYPYAESYAGNAHTGSYSLRFITGVDYVDALGYNGSQYYADNLYAVMPAIDTTAHPINTLMVSFYAKLAMSSSYTIYVGVMTDQNDTSTFVATDTIELDSKSFKFYQALLTNYTGTGVYPAIYVKSPMYEPAGTSEYVNIDDLTIDLAPTCPDIRGEITATGLSDSSIVVTMPDATAKTHWELAYRKVGETSFSTIDVLDTLAYTFTTLDEASTYEFKARKACAADDHSAWTAIVTAKTYAVPATMPYVCGFEDDSENSKWQYEDGTHETLRIGSNSNAVNSGEKAMYVTPDGGTSYSYNQGTLTFAYRLVHMESKKYNITYNWKANGANSSSGFGKFILLPKTYELVPGGGTTSYYLAFPDTVASFEPIDANGYHILNNVTRAEGTAATDWQTASHDFDMTGKEGDYNLVIVWNCSSSASKNQPPLSIDNISIQELTCEPAPLNTFTVTGISQNGATISIGQSGASNWEVIVDAQPISAVELPASPVLRQTTTGPLSVTGLNANSDYYYMARTICGEGDTSLWSQMGTFHTYCPSVAVPFAEGFENNDNFTCWITMGEGSNLMRSSLQSHGGTYSMLVTNTAVSTPMLDTTSLAGFMVHGYAYSAADSVRFTTGVFSDPSDISTFEAVSEILMPRKHEWTEFYAFLDTLSSGNYDSPNAQFVGFSVVDASIYFDDIEIVPLQSCMQPASPVIDNITATSFDISFTARAGQNKWVVRANEQEQEIITNPATITGLTGKTNYVVSIATICGNDTSDFVSCGTIRTECDSLWLPYVCGFEKEEGWTSTDSYSPGFEENCWMSINSNQSQPYAMLTTSSSYRVSGQGLYITSKPISPHFFMILPEFKAPTNALDIQFAAKFENTTRSGDLELGYMTDVNDTLTWVSILNSRKAVNYGTVNNRIRTDTVAGIPANARLAFRFGPANTTSATSNYRAALDNIYIKEIKSCSDPEIPTISAVTAHTAIVGITDTCAAHDTYEYAVGYYGFNPRAVTPVTISDTNSFILTGLDANRNYEVYVRAKCGVGDESNWTSASFTTLCDPVTISAANPFHDSFEDAEASAAYANNCYEMQGQSSSYYIKGQANTDYTSYQYLYAHSGEKCLNFNVSKTGTQEGLSIMREFNLEAGKTYKIYGYAFTSSSKDQIVEFLAGTTDQMWTMETLNAIPISGKSYTSRTEGGKTYYDYTQCYEQVAGYFQPQTTGTYVIAIRCQSTDYGNVYFDDFTIEESDDCVPTMFAVTQIGSNSATIELDDTDNSHIWKYSVKDQTGAVIMQDTARQAAFTISGLASASNYSISICRICSADNNSIDIIKQFKTICGQLSLPYSTSFETSEGFIALNYGYVENAVEGNCFATLNMSSSGAYGHVSSSYASQGSYSYAFSGNVVGNDYPLLILPEFVEPASRLLVEFKVQDYNGNCNVTVGYVTNVNNASSWVELTTLHKSGYSWQSFDVDFTEYDVPAGARIAFTVKDINYNDVFIDNLKVSVCPTCREPRSAAVIAGTTMTTANVEVDMNGKPKAEVACFVRNTETVVASLETTTGTAQFTGLTASTQYDVKYRYICNVGDTSLWSPAATATTTASDCFAPQNVRIVGEIGAHNATLTWGGAPDAVAYHYELRANGALVDSATITTDTAVFTALNPLTSYTFKVQSICSGDATSYKSKYFTTTAEVYDVPFVCDFEATDDAGKFLVINQNVYQYGNGGVFTVGTAEHNGAGTKSMYFSEDYGTSASYISGSSSAEALINMPAGTYNISYDWKCLGGGYEDPDYPEYSYYYDYGMAFLAPSDHTIDDMACHELDNSFISLMNARSYLMNSTTWTTENVTVTIPEDETYKLVFTFICSEWESYTPSLCIDNISITAVEEDICDTITTFPYYENFETIAAEDIDALEASCWQKPLVTSIAAHAYADNNTSCIHSGTQGLDIYNGAVGTQEQILVMPEMGDINSMSLSFWHKASSTDAANAQLMTGYYRGGVFTALNTAVRDNNWAQVEVMYNNIPDSSRMAFKVSGLNSYYLDDIRINRVVAGDEYYDTLCAGNAYTEHGFNVFAAELQTGDNTFTRKVLSTTQDVSDSIYTAHVYVLPAVSSEIFDTVCANEPYIKGEWNIASPRSTQPYSTLAPYSQSFTSAAGCDSLVVLHLYVMPAAVTVFDTICQGDAYHIGTYTHTVTGIYHDTIVSAKGCPQVYTVNLLVVDSTDTTVVTICAGESYIFEGQSYNQTGVYPVQTTGLNGCPLTRILDLTVVQTDTVCNVSFCEGGQVMVDDTVITTAGTYELYRLDAATGCTMVYHITATEVPAEVTDVNDYICEGEKYSGYELVDIEITEDTTITIRTRTTDNLCDSVINLHIAYVPTAYGDTTATISEGQTFTWHNNTYTVAGDYNDTMQTTGQYVCDSIVTLHLVVVDGVENVTSVKVDVVPNPTTVGMTTYVYGDFEDVETVEILNNFGQVVDSFVPVTYPIEIEGIQASGLYYVRLVTKDGNVYTEKLIVK